MRSLAAILLFALMIPRASRSEPAPFRLDFERWDTAWDVRGKPGTSKAEFAVQEAETAPGETNRVLVMSADKASASLLLPAKGVDLRKTPILRWRWRIRELPAGADGREDRKDDQAIGIYVGMKSGLLSQQSVAYRWETETPTGQSGDTRYGGGTVKIRWFALRNKSHPADEWVTEERNVAEDIRTAYGKLPDEVILSVSCNSQYTGTRARAELDWIEFDAQPEKKNSKKSDPSALPSSSNNR